MSWRTEWNVLSQRIRGLADAATYAARAGVRIDDHLPHDAIPLTAAAISETLVAFWTRHHKQMPASIVSPIFRFKGGFDSHLQGKQVKTVVALMLVRSEVEQLLVDTQAVTQSLTERAFEHLQRSIVADEDVMSKWKTAFARRQAETACEKLGAAHLLAHGIWAFKANSAGERTDLILQEPMRDADIEKSQRVAQGLVLTEWKLVRKESDIQAQARQGREQAYKYSAGSLAGFELSSKRYIILVSTQIDIGRLPDEDVDGVTYHHVSIRVAPLSPSKSRVSPPRPTLSKAIRGRRAAK